jgi:hypothetical protein
LLFRRTALLLFAAACGSAEQFNPRVLHDPCAALCVMAATDATEDQRAAVAAAIASWNARGFTQLTLDDAADRVAISFKPASPAFHGFYDGDTGEVAINSTLTEPHPLAVVIAHELGHAMGLAHVDPNIRASVMNGGNTTISPTPEDSEAIAASCH